jgi:hypothetical protein
VARELRRKDGTFAGSIGSGKTAAPTPAPHAHAPVTGTPHDTGLPDEAAAILADLHERYLTRQQFHEVTIGDFTHIKLVNGHGAHVKLETDPDDRLVMVHWLESPIEGHGYATTLMREVYRRYPGHTIDWQEIKHPASEHLVAKFATEYASTHTTMSNGPWNGL